MKKSKFMTIDFNDAVRSVTVGTLSAGAAAFGRAIYSLLDTGVLPSLDDTKKAALAGLAAATGYILKNLFTNSDDMVFKRDVK